MEIWAHKTSLTPPLFIEVSVPRQESERSCICVLGVLILPVSMGFLLYLPVSTGFLLYLARLDGFSIIFCPSLRVFYYILDLFRRCGIFPSLFYMYLNTYTYKFLNTKQLSMIDVVLTLLPKFQ